MKSIYHRWMIPAIFLLLVFCSGKSVAQHSNWTAPANADKLTNPLKENPDAFLEGKKTYESMCLVCHGDKGKGNGAASVSLSPHPANFLSIEVRHESDGAIFWKMTEGNPPMAAYKTLLTETQRWQLVCYIRKLESQSK
jgi:mono/diheme cytochrome c family protein